MLSLNIRSNLPISPEHRAEANRMQTEKTLAQQELDSMIATQPNLNDIYKAEISAIQQEFQREGLPIAPITVLESTEFDEARRLMEIDGENKEGGENPYGTSYTGGTSFADHNLIKAPAQHLGEQAKKDSVLSVGLHEAAHSIGDPYELSAIVRGYPIHNLGRYTTQLALIHSHRGSFKKVKIPTHEEDGWQLEGAFFEEGFADSIRVEALRGMGRQVTHILEGSITARMPLGTRAKFLKGADLLPVVDQDGTITLPLDYLDFYTMTKESSDGRIMISPSWGYNTSSLAAYGIALLDQKAPGLLETMKAARHDPKQQAVFIKIINSIEPGLYGRLRRLKYDDLDFAEGLKMISNAVNKADVPAYKN